MGWVEVVIGVLSLAVLVYFVFLRPRSINDNVDVHLSGADSLGSQFDVNFESGRAEYDAKKMVEGISKQNLMSALTRRAMDVIEKVDFLNQNRKTVIDAHNNNVLPPRVWEQFCDANNRANEEIVALQTEANSLKDGWGDTILDQSCEILRHTKRKEYMEEQRKAAIQEAEREKKEEARRVKREAAESKRREQQAAKQANKLADELIREEERLANKSLRKRGGENGAKKGR